MRKKPGILLAAIALSSVMAVAGCNRDHGGGGGAAGFADGADLVSSAEDFAARMCACPARDQECALGVESRSPHPFMRKGLNMESKLTPDQHATWQAARIRYIDCVVAINKK